MPKTGFHIRGYKWDATMRKAEGMVAKPKKKTAGAWSAIANRTMGGESLNRGAKLHTAGPAEHTLFGDQDPHAAIAATLKRRFTFPPFSVLNARDGAWQARKRAWTKMGIQSSLGRFDNLLGSDRCDLGPQVGDSSIFDPVLCELAYRWFCPPGGSVLDPFAGGSVRGVVAGCLGHPYTGVDIRPEQVEANEYQAKAMPWLDKQPRWITGDSANLRALIPKRPRHDMVFTCPPYYDLEIYSEREKDGSAFATYATFMSWYAAIFRTACHRLAPNRFAVVVVGEIRDKKTGIYRNFVGDTIRCFTDLGLAYYNEIILVTAIGSLPVRTARAFDVGRKVGKTHQNVLAFYKGDPKTIRKHFPKFKR